VKKSTKLIEFLTKLKTSLKFTLKNINIWEVQRRYNQTFRPMRLINLKNNLFQLMYKLEDSENVNSSKNNKSLTLFIDIVNEFNYFNNLISEKEAVLDVENEDDRLIFFKFYEPNKASLKYVFKLIVSVNSNLSKFI
jgi:hypothetical protein